MIPTLKIPAAILAFFACFITASLHAQNVTDPLSLPYEQRSAFFKKGNLVQNPSFEKGQGQGSSLQLNAWTVKGSDVEWVDKSSFQYSTTEVYDGARSIRIQRKTAGEIDEGEGVSSDFIEVIPGNYQFTMYLKMSDIESGTQRLGTRIFDAVDIRLLYFDEQKKPLDPKVLFPCTNNYIDNSFKGFSFSNFWQIDNFDWGMVIGRTYNYPYSEGDIPANCRFVKVYVGLKGSGTLWIDKVDLRYSKWNFTPLERMQAYKDKELSLIDMLVPQPKQISNIKRLKWYDKEKPAQIPVILLPAKPDKQTLIASQLLKGRLEANLKLCLGKDWKKELVVVTSRLTDSLSKAASFIFSLGTNELCLRYADSLPQKWEQSREQAYYIKTVAGRMMFLKGNTPLGDYYAVTTLVQLLENKDCILQSATILDYPDFTGRSMLFAAWNSSAEVKEDLTNLDAMAKWKINKAYVGYGQPNKNWHTPTEVYKGGVSAAANWCRKTGLVNLAVMVNPYYHLGYEQNVDSISESNRYIWTHGDPYSLNILKNVLKPALDSGAKCIMLSSDDYLPHQGRNPKNYTLYTKEDEDRFINLQNAQAYVIDELYKWLESDYPGTRLEFCPPWYLNEYIDMSRGKAEAYFSDLKALIPKEVAVVWTGNTVRSLSLDNADIYRYSQMIGRYPMLWDNTLYARSTTGKNGGYPSVYPVKSRLCNLFEPLDILVPEHFSRYNDGPDMYVNGDMYSDTYKIKFMTVADFEWNTDAYDADFSLWKALVKTYGKENAIKLMTFNDTFYRLVQHVLYVDALNGSEKDNKTTGDALVKDITTQFNDIAKVLETQKKLVAELRYLKDEQLKAYKAAMEKFHTKTKGK
jgi:hypothetical protein